MKKLFLFLCSVMSFAAFAQTNPSYNTVRVIPGTDSTTVTSNGTIRYNSTSNKFRFRQNGSWVSLGSGGGGISGLTIGTTTITSGTNTRILFNNSGVLGEYSIIPSSLLTDGAADGSTKGISSFTANDFNSSSGNISIDYTNGQAANGSTKGFLTSTDWNTFSGKQSSITFGTGVQTALGVNIGSAGAPVLFNGALGTPSGATLSNATGLPISTGLSGAGTGVLTALGNNVNSSGGVITSARSISTTSPLSGGGDLSSNRTLTIADASVSTKGAAQFNSNHFDDDGAALISLDVAALTASETVSGFSEEATQSETDAGTATGGTGAKLFVTPEKLAAYNKLKAVYITGTVATTSASLGDVTGLQFPVTAGKHYRFRFVIPYSSSATTNGCQWALNGPTLTTLNYHQIFPISTSAMSYQPTLAAYNTSTASSNNGSTGTNLCIMEGIITCSASGNVIARFATEAGGTITVLGYASVDYLQLD